LDVRHQPSIGLDIKLPIEELKQFAFTGAVNHGCVPGIGRPAHPGGARSTIYPGYRFRSTNLTLRFELFWCRDKSKGTGGDQAPIRGPPPPPLRRGAPPFPRPAPPAPPIRAPPQAPGHSDVWGQERSLVDWRGVSRSGRDNRNRAMPRTG